MAKKKEYRVPKRKQPVWKFVRPILKLFFKKPKKIINLAGELQDKSIILSNHSAKKGPMLLELHFPIFCVKWGAHQMLGSYKERFHYLRDVFYIQKCGKGKFSSTLKAGFESLFSIFFYRGMKILPTYQDTRFMMTIRNSCKCLENDVAVMIYPENSNEGYKEVLTEFHPGFAMLAEKYYKQSSIDVPIYPVYYEIKKRVIVIGKPVYMQELIKQGMTREEICVYYRDLVNNLFFDYIKGKEF